MYSWKYYELFFVFFVDFIIFIILVFGEKIEIVLNNDCVVIYDIDF